MRISSHLQSILPVRFDRVTILLIVLSLVLGVVIPVTVGQFGWLTLIVIPAILVVVATIWNPNLGLILLTFVIYAQVQRVVTEFHDLPVPGKPLVAFLLLVVAIRFLVFNERPEIWIKNSFLLGIYLIFLTISTVSAAFLSPALEELIDVVQNLIVASIVLFIIRDSAALKGAIWAIIIAGVFMATISVFQNLTGTFSNNYWGFGGWEYSGYVGRPRMTGPYETPNPYAQVLVAIFILALDRLWHDRSTALRMVALYASVITALAMIYTDSRGGFANMVFTILIFFMFNRPRLPALLITVILATFLLRFLPANYTDRILTLTELNPFGQDSTALYDESFRGRTSENLAALQMFLDHPVLGVGLNNYAEYYQDYSRGIGLDNRREARDPASLYLQLLADQGLVGTFVFLAMMTWVFVNLLRAHGDFRSAGVRDDAYITSALFAALAGYMFMAIYRNNAYTNVFWMLVAVCIAASQVAVTMLHDRGDSDGTQETFR